MTVLRACGYGATQLMHDSFKMASVVVVLVSIITFWGNPLIAVERAKLLRATGVQTLIQTIMPGRFHALNGGNQVFYVHAMNRDHTQAEQIFLAKKSVKNNQTVWDVLWANKAFAERNSHSGEEYLILEEGREYQGMPGSANYQLAEFKQYKARLPQQIYHINEDVRTAKTRDLWPLNNKDLAKAVELQWRLSIPFMVFILTLIAIPLSHVNPRSGKFAKIVPAVLIYILYANCMFVARDALMSQKIPLWLGMWWVHGLFIVLGLILFWRSQVKLG